MYYTITIMKNKTKQEDDMNRQRYTIIDERFGDGIEPVTTEQFFDMVEDHAAESD